MTFYVRFCSTIALLALPFIPFHPKAGCAAAIAGVVLAYLPDLYRKTDARPDLRTSRRRRAQVG